MNVSINVGKYEVIANGNIDVFGKNDVTLNINDGNTLRMVFTFIDNRNTLKTYFEREITEDTLTWKVVNMNRSFTVLGMNTPEHIGEYNSGKKMYFSFSVNAINVDNGIYNIKYVFWKETES